MPDSLADRVTTLLVATDLHGSTNAVWKLKEAAQEHQPDLLVLLGDLTNFGPVEWAKDLLEQQKVPTIFVPGNCDPPALLDLNEPPAYQCIHGKRLDMEGLSFAGWGGSPSGAFQGSFHWSPDVMKSGLEPLIESLDVLVLHCPPLGRNDLTPSGIHAGSPELAELVSAAQPRLVLSGHIHEATGVIQDGTTYLNPGPAMNSLAAVVNISGSGVWVTLI